MKRVFKFLKWFFLLLIVVFISSLIYINANKKELINQLTKEISENINGEVKVGNVEISFFKSFPHFSVLLTNVSVIDSAFQTHNHKFFNCEKIFLRLSLVKIIKKEPFVSAISLQNGKLYFYTAENGYSNSYLIETKKEGTGKQKNISLKKVTLKDFEIIVDQKQTEKFHDILFEDMSLNLDKQNSVFSFDIKTELLVKSLVFNPEKGSFLQSKKVAGKFLLNFDNDSKKLSFDKIKLNIGKQPFLLTGKFDMEGNERQFSLHVETVEAKYSLLVSLLPAQLQKSLSIVYVDKPFKIFADIGGPLKGGDPKVYSAWDVKNVSMRTNFMDFENASFKGFFTNEVVEGAPRKDPNSKILINDFNADWHGIPVSSTSIEILNLSTPLLTANLKSDFKLNSLNDLIGSNSLLFKNGDGLMSLNYSGPIERNNNTNSFLNGNIEISNGNLTYLPRDVEMRDVSSRIVFKNSDVFVQDLRTTILGQKIIMNGEGKKLLSFIQTNPEKAILKWNIYSPSLNLTPFSFLLNEKKKQTSNNKGIVATANRIDDILEDATLDVNFKSPKIKYNNFIAENVVANILLLPDKYTLKNISMNHAGGVVDVEGVVSGLNKSRHALKINADFINVNVKQVFFAFDDFGQKAISHENLEGKLSAKVSAEAILGKDGKILPQSINSIVDFSLKNGSLINYEPLKKIQQFVFKKRDFENIRFAELKDRLEIKDEEIKINKMEIQSSVLTLIVQGLYSKKGNSDISIQVPLNNLKKRSKDFDPKNKGLDKKFGTSIFLRGTTGSDGSIDFKLDLFNRYKKDKAAKEN